MLRRLLAKSHEARPVLGRWSLKYDEHQVNRVVHYANEDHCGCCTNGPSKEIKHNNSKRSEKKTQYYIPFIL